MRQVLNDLISDVGRKFQISTAGDLAFIASLEDKVLLDVMDQLLKDLLASTERRCEVLNPPVALTDRLKGAYCNFLRSVRRLIFDGSGRELAFPDHSAFACLYQVYSFSAKFGAGEMTPGMIANAISSYHYIEDSMVSPTIPDNILRYARSEIQRVLSYATVNFSGRHGPGAVAEGKIPSGEKYGWSAIDVDPLYYPFCLREYYSRDVPSFGSLGSLSDPRASRWCAVPKSYSKVRAICAEPALLQYMQQSIGKALSFAIEVCPQCGVGLRHQDANARLALESSAHGYFCTLDLSSASDRLSLELVETLFPRDWFRELSQCRSHRTVFPDGHVLDLKKFGSMGNATTFPVQGLVYWALLVALLRDGGSSIYESRTSVYAYGDDLILPSTHAKPAIALLEAVGLSVNRDKSFVSGSFRESCGMHAYHGFNVTPAYLRTTARTGPGLVSMCACANQLYLAGFDGAARRLFSYIERTLATRLPVVGGGGNYGLPYSPQLAEIRPDLSVQALVLANHERGIKTLTGRLGYPTVKAFGLFELRTKRISNPFACFGDIWDFTHGVSGSHDRGYIPGKVALSQRRISLL